jgi:hypothetical protein
MRNLSLILSFLATVSVAGGALIYLEERVGQHRIQVQAEWLGNTSPDTTTIAVRK